MIVLRICPRPQIGAGSVEDELAAVGIEQAWSWMSWRRSGSSRRGRG
jgi:hypothetical protein